MTLWNIFSQEEKDEYFGTFKTLIEETQALADTQLLTFSMVTPKADLGFMMMTPDLHVLDQVAKQLENSLGHGVLVPTFSWLSMTERSEYGMNDEEYAAKLEQEEGIIASMPIFKEKMKAFSERITKYTQDRLYPELPEAMEWPVFCFYPMSKRRNLEQNWYALPLEVRKKLMQGHALVGRRYAGRVRQFITGSTGLDDHEWGVSLFAKTTSSIKEIVYEMRFDEVSVKYAEFGEFFIGIQMDFEQLLKRLGVK